MSKTAFPITVRRGNVRVKIYKTPSHGCDSFTVAYYFGGRRQRRTFADLALAKQEAEIVANKICVGELDVLTLTSANRTAYVRSLELLQPFHTPLEMAVMQFTEAAKLLDGASLVEAAKFYARHRHRKLVPRTVPEVVTEFVEAKTTEGASAVYARELRTRLGRFAKAFSASISMVLARELQDYLQDLKCGARSKNNTRRALKMLFRFAQRRGHLPKGPTEADELQLMKTPPVPIGIFRPEQMARLLQQAEPRLRSFLAIGAFTGLRHAEIMRLDWAEVDLAGGFIQVQAHKAKTASRRLVPIAENLKHWLAPLHPGSGKVIPFSDPYLIHQLRRLAKATQVPWPQNGLRHSFISYRVAQVQNVPQVALEAGNSPEIIFRNYRELVKPAEAVKWFAIEPELPANVIPAPITASPISSDADPSAPGTTAALR